jgi:hypothetical protein
MIPVCNPQNPGHLHQKRVQVEVADAQIVADSMVMVLANHR